MNITMLAEKKKRAKSKIKPTPLMIAVRQRNWNLKMVKGCVANLWKMYYQSNDAITKIWVMGAIETLEIVEKHIKREYEEFKSDNPPVPIIRDKRLRKLERENRL